MAVVAVVVVVVVVATVAIVVVVAIVVAPMWLGLVVSRLGAGKAQFGDV